MAVAMAAGPAALAADAAVSAHGTAAAERPAALIVPLWKGKTGPAVSALQIQLKFQYGFTSVNVDGQFGHLTKSAVRAFQKRYGLTPSGIVGERTWNALVVHDTK